ncbi:hypothetical protein D3C77_411670 [compost metagenome]
MAKLVEILARELKAWPEGITHMTQSIVDREIYNAHGGGPDDTCEPLEPEFYVSERNSEKLSYPIVTRTMWQSELDRQKGGEWKRHRGGKQPVDSGEYVEVRLRDGDIQKSYARCFAWHYSACDHYANIMAFRILEKPEQEEKEVERKGESLTLEYQFCGEGEEPKSDAWQEIGGNPQNIGTLTYNIDLNTEPAMQKIEELQAKWDQLDGPLKWRDGVSELEAYIEEFTRQRDELVKQLEGEGFSLIPHNATTQGFSDQADMQDWRNWKAGDVVEVVSANEEGVDIGRRGSVIIIENAEYDGRAPVHVNFDGDEIWPFSFRGNDQCVLKFIRRP